MDPVKVKGIMDWPTPQNVSDVWKFCGFANFYRRFIQDFSRVTRPLTALVKKGVPWSWGAAQQAAFDELKARFTEAPILAMPDLSQPFVVE